MRSMLTATLIFVAAGASAQAQMTPPSTAGTKPKPVATVPIRPGAADPGRYRQCDGAGRASGDPVGSGLGRPVQRRHHRRSQRAHGGRHQGIPESPGRQADRRAQSAGAQRAGRNREAAAGQCRLEDRHRCRHRGAARRADQAGAAAIQRRQRRQMEFLHRHHPDSAGAAQGSQPDHGETRRAGKEGTRRAHHRLHRGQAGFLRAVGHAGPEEILPARHVQGRRGPHPHHPLRPGHRRHRRAGGDRDVERVQSVSDRRADRGPAAAQDRRIRHRRGRQRRRRDRRRPPDHRWLPGDRDCRLRQCRSRRRGQGP